MHTIERKIVSYVRSEVVVVMKDLQDAVLTALENLSILKVQLSMNSVKASSSHGIGSVVSDPDHRDFSGNSKAYK